MRALLSCVAPLLIASVASADVITYNPTRDTFMRGPNDLHGTSPSGRASKAFLDFYLADFDRVSIMNSIQSQLGHPLALEDMDKVELSLNLFSNDSQGYKPTALSRPAVFQGSEDWVEGTNTTLGATKLFAVFDPVNSNNNRTWKTKNGTEVASFQNLDRVQNAVFEEWGGQAFTYREWVLDDSVAFAYLTDPQSLGLFLNASDAGNDGDQDAKYNNTEVFSRETPDPSRLPYLEVVVDAIPEPGSLSQLGLGALLLIRRHRR